MTWSLAQANRIYNVPQWSEGYFQIDQQGLLCVKDGDQLYPLEAILHQASQMGLQRPLLMRFPHIIHDRVQQLIAAFQRAIHDQQYQGTYQAVYPIKVNQQRRVVEAIVQGQLQAGQSTLGLEAGSKPELLAVLAQAEKAPTVIVCNGYKDPEFIRLALLAERLGHTVYIVIEKSGELDWVLDIAQQLEVTPRIGVRARLANTGKGKWEDTGGDKSKFGLTAAEILHLLKRLQERDAMGSLQLLHFHLGSQIANIRDIHTGLLECARIFSELHALGANIRTVDVGGGLGVDYEGARSQSSCSMNYTPYEYAWQVVHAFANVCDPLGIAHPNIITESGRAVTAHHAVLISEVIDHEPPYQGDLQGPEPDSHRLLLDAWNAYQELQQGIASSSEVWNDIAYIQSEAIAAFTHGDLSLSERAAIEGMVNAIAIQLRSQLSPARRAHREILDEINGKLADKYFVNFSLFQSLPDVWGIDQVFPIVPLHRLNEEPTHRAVIQDMTCDSDGRIDTYIDGDSLENSLPVPPWRDDQPLLIGFFMVGAYQEILGDLHNLFGDSDAVDVLLAAEGVQLKHATRGDTVDTVLRYVNFSSEQMLASYSRQLARSNLSRDQQNDWLASLRRSLQSGTYLRRGSTS